MGGDGEMLRLVISDDDALTLLRPGNGVEISAAVKEAGWFPRTLRFEYPHAGQTADEWATRCDQLGQQIRRANWRTGLSGQQAAVCEQLYNQVLERGRRLTCLAVAMANRQQAITNDCLQRLWGPPPTQLEYKTAVEDLRRRATNESGSLNEVVQRLASELLAQLPQFDTVAQYRDQPRAGAVERLTVWAQANLGFIRDHVEAQGFESKVKLNAEQIASAYRVILAQFECDVEVLVGDYSAVTFLPTKSQVCIPLGRKMTPGILIKHLAHEFVHILRWRNGGRGLLELGSVGTGAHLPFEEGLAVATAQVLFQPEKEISYGEPDATVAIGLAREGYDAVYKVMRLWYAMKMAALAAKKGGVDYKQVMTDAHDKAMTRLVRTCRGLTGGYRFANTRDLCYRRGAESVWWYIETATEEQMARLLCAKVDLDDPVQLDYAKL